MGVLEAMAIRVAAGDTVEFRPTGSSMIPLIRSRDLVHVAPVEPTALEIGDIVLARVSGTVYLHLVSAIDAGRARVQISNNRGHINGWTTFERVFGICTSVEGGPRPHSDRKVRAASPPTVPPSARTCSQPTRPSWRDRDVRGGIRWLPVGAAEPIEKVSFVRVESEDGSFAVRLVPAGSPYDSRFFVFQLRIGDVILGDGQPAIEWTSVTALTDLEAVDDPRVDPDSHTAQDLVDALTAEHDDGHPYDRTLVGFGEGLDAYVARAYLWRDEAIMLFREHEATQSNGPTPVIMARINAAELRAIATAVMAAHRSYGYSPQ